MRTEAEMQLTLARLRDEFGLDISSAADLHGQELADWLARVEDDLFHQLLRDTRGPQVTE